MNAYLLTAVMTAVNALTSLGFSLVALNSVGEAQVNAEYAVSRSLSLALLAVALFVWRSRPALILLALVMTGVQLGDTIIGILIHDPMKTFGPLLLAVLTAGAAFRLSRTPERR
ncbi:hypothetical protein K7W42_07815 [Deinococcus sp. HMF7604]|uniref:hypothetical protein n=1 Tax=Deinococcus betulae TaxID=2873312 RepID=UPI001CCB3C12|nr:hypothetical protein [Deinococcus betulae]MBZ9750766.1 hypothetical protein [Deinococcus betulae]